MKSSRALLAFVAATAMGSGYAQEDGAPKGVNPKDLVTKVDLIARRDDFQGGVMLDSLTFKYDRGLDAHWGMAIELPLARFKAPGISESGMAESKVKFRRVENSDWGAFLVGGEFVLPTDSKRSLGSGKWQFNPSVGAVLSLTPTVFAFAGYQHFLSVAGRDDAPRINQSQPRLLLAKTSAAGWWVMSDLKYTLDHETSSKTLDVELEAGRMVARDWAVSLRLIESGFDSTRSWGAVVVLRHLF
ncbi:hypothetical protein [Roseateles albus]|uniref:Transporter n=1 Tax=Roseateles albus TaxID=2987525 RepID=A0ABT5KGG5_9BURK|nr:hypothetical protein [Roseateles albus]MDC8773019.1 hypothetical protein [Roseateles albus]